MMLATRRTGQTLLGLICIASIITSCIPQSRLFEAVKHVARHGNVELAGENA